MPHSPDTKAQVNFMVGLRYQNAKSVLTVAGDPLPVPMARPRRRRTVAPTRYLNV
jgi:hypothetical protein